MKKGLIMVAVVLVIAALMPLLWALLSVIMIAIAAIGALLVACPVIAVPVMLVGAIIVLAIIGVISLFKGSGNPKTSEKK